MRMTAYKFKNKITKTVKYLFLDFLVKKCKAEISNDEE